MTSQRLVLSMLAALAIVASAASCSVSPSSGNGSGGTPGNGGTTVSSGGSVASGGSIASGGTTASGGQPGTGGLTGVGGRVGTGGAPGLGGASGVGGRIGTGGRSATGGTSVTADGGQSGTGGSAANGGRTGRGGQPGTGGAVGGGTAGGQTGAGGAAGGSTGGPGSPGCGKTPSTLKNSPSTANQNTLTISGKSRQFIIRWPDNYDNNKPHRLIFGLHGATGKDTDIGPSYFGLFSLANGSTIFVAPSADGGLWSAATDTTFVSEILKVVQAELCIDTSRIMLEGFSQGAAMSWTLACSLTGVFRAVVGHSGGGVANPSKCDPVAYFGSGGKQENVTQTTQSDQFARWNTCTIETFAAAPTGGHTCNDYKGCSAGHPVRWCPFDGPHTPSPTDSGQSSSWMPKEVWTFVSQF